MRKFTLVSSFLSFSLLIFLICIISTLPALTKFIFYLVPFSSTFVLDSVLHLNILCDHHQFFCHNFWIIIGSSLFCSRFIKKDFGKQYFLGSWMLNCLFVPFYWRIAWLFRKSLAHIFFPSESYRYCFTISWIEVWIKVWKSLRTI